MLKLLKVAVLSLSAFCFTKGAVGQVIYVSSTPVVVEQPVTTVTTTTISVPTTYITSPGVISTQSILSPIQSVVTPVSPVGLELRRGGLFGNRVRARPVYSGSNLLILP